MSITAILAAIAGSICFLMSLTKWRLGLYGLLLYLPFAGMVSLMSGQSTLALLAKDLVFVIPLYISFFAFYPNDARKASLPALMYVPMLMIALLVIFESANPAIPDPLIAAIGAKVWLLYMPLAFITSAAINSEEDLRQFLRFNVIIGLAPIAIGLLQLIGIQTIGAESTAAALYGSSLDTNDYALFANLADYGSLYRINSTFSAVGQYYIYTLALVAMSATMAISDPTRRWRIIGTAVLFIAIAAAFLSGQRGAVIFVPIVLVPIMLLAGRIVELLLLGCVLPVLYVAALTASGTDVEMVVNDAVGFTTYYAEQYGWNMMIGVLMDNPIGAGTGMNTGAARYALGPLGQLWIGMESYYLKTVYELSVLALPAVLLLLWLPIAEGVKLAASSLSTEVRRCAAGLTGFFTFVALYSIRNWPLDIDPVSVYFWVFAGVLFKLHRISSSPTGEFEATAATAPGSRLPAFATANPNS
jgi:hypothetical protein